MSFPVSFATTQYVIVSDATLVGSNGYPSKTTKGFSALDGGAWGSKPYLNFEYFVVGM